MNRRAERRELPHDEHPPDKHPSYRSYFVWGLNILPRTGGRPEWWPGGDRCRPVVGFVRFPTSLALTFAGVRSLCSASSEFGPTRSQAFFCVDDFFQVATTAKDDSVRVPSFKFALCAIYFSRLGNSRSAWPEAHGLTHHEGLYKTRGSRGSRGWGINNVPEAYGMPERRCIDVGHAS